MNRLRTASTLRLAAILAVAAALALSAGIAQGALTGSGPPPPPKALADAILAAFKAPAPEGITARIEFENKLLPSGSLPHGAASPLMSGADGRLWVQKSGDFRIELQSRAGDVQIVGVGDRITVYDASSQTLYRATLPAHTEDVRRPGRGHRGERLTLAKVQRALDRLARTWIVSGARPTSIAGQPAYAVRIAPKDDGGLLGAAELAWDAVRGAPLRAAVYARDRTDPVLELEATEVSYGPVADADVRVSPPSGAEIVDLSVSKHARGTAQRRGAKPGSARVEGRAEVQRRLDFPLAAPATLAGLPRTEVRLVTVDGDRAALAIYGEGLGAIAVLQRKARPGTREEDEGERDLRLPEVDIDGAPGRELATALGTVVTFERGGVAYLVAGSVPPAAAEDAARGLR